MMFKALLLGQTRNFTSRLARSVAPARALLAPARALGAGLLAVSAIAGCATSGSFLHDAPYVAEISVSGRALRELPAPRKKVVIAVYKFADLTGQNKETGANQSLSRAVTQGGAPILVKSLQDAGERRWFTVLERSELNNLLKERQIVAEMRRVYRGEQQINAKALPPLLHAGIIIEGGIVGYDTNVHTGGIGARYLGIGGDTKYFKDVVTISLRAVSTKTGEVLASVTTRKEVASYALQGGMFSYIKLDELLEAEAGITHNEPKQIAVEAAIEKAVLGLIVEGAELGIWDFADRAAGADFIAQYRQEKYGDQAPITASYVPRPKTRNATSLSQTVPRKIARSTVTTKTKPIVRTQPTAPQNQTPPPQRSNEKPIG